MIFFLINYLQSTHTSAYYIYFWKYRVQLSSITFSCFQFFRNFLCFIPQTTDSNDSCVYFCVGSDLRRVGKIQLRTYTITPSKRLVSRDHYNTLHLKQRVNIVSARRNSIRSSRPSHNAALCSVYKIVQTRTRIEIWQTFANAGQNTTNGTKTRANV